MKDHFQNATVVLVKSNKATARAGKFNLTLRTPRIFWLQKLGVHFSVPSVELLVHGLHSNRLRNGQIVQLSNIILQIVKVKPTSINAPTFRGS